MIFYFLISIVFIAEVIITITLITWLCKADKKIVKYDAILNETKPSIKEVMILVRKISNQLVEFAPIITDKLKSFFINLFVGQAKNLLATIIFWLVKKEVEKHI